jgi:hypothetical protein
VSPLFHLYFKGKEVIMMTDETTTDRTIFSDGKDFSVLSAKSNFFSNVFEPQF